MSEQTAQGSGDAAGGAVLKALAGAAAGGAATYAVRKALASRNGHDHSDDESTESNHSAIDDSAEDEQDASEDEDMDDEYPEDEYEEASAASDVEYEDDDSEELTAGSSDSSSRGGGLRGLVTPARLESASQLLLPLAEQAAGSAGRYVGEHAPETVRRQIIPRFIDAFEEAH